MQARADHLARTKIPLVMFVAVLALGTDVGNLLGYTGRCIEGLAEQPVATRAAIRLRPDRAGDGLEQPGLARAIATDQQPTLSGPDAPRDVAQHGTAAAIEIDAVERDGNMCMGGASARNASAEV